MYRALLRVLRAMGGAAGARLHVVDFGSGAGNATLALAWLLRERCRFTLLDMKPRAVALAKQRAAAVPALAGLVEAEVAAAALPQPCTPLRQDRSRLFCAGRSGGSRTLRSPSTWRWRCTPAGWSRTTPSSRPSAPVPPSCWRYPGSTPAPRRPALPDSYFGDLARRRILGLR